MKTKFPKIVPEFEDSKTWDEWLEKMDLYLKGIGYKKYVQNFKKEDFAYWKSFEIDGEKVYQIGLLFYDFRPYADRDPGADRISIQFECMFTEIDCRIDLAVSKDIWLFDFQDMALTFYNAMKQYK